MNSCAVSLETNGKLSKKKQQIKQQLVSFMETNQRAETAAVFSCSGPVRGDPKSPKHSLSLSPERVNLPPWTHLGVTWRRSRWAAWTSADRRRSPAASPPWPDTGTRPGCVCTAERRRAQAPSHDTHVAEVIADATSEHETALQSFQHKDRERSRLAPAGWKLPTE